MERRLFLCGAPAALLMATPLGAEAAMIEDFTDAPETRWRYVSDQVMGGVSEGGATFGIDDATPYLRLTGDVSTRNRGGFVQARRDVSLPPDSNGLILRVRGNGQRYYVHLRTMGLRMPWQFFQAGFDANADWQEVRLAWDDFAPQGGLSGPLSPARISSLGLVAYGRDHVADVSVSRISLF